MGFPSVTPLDVAAQAGPDILRDVFFEDDEALNFGRLSGETDQEFGRVFFDTAVPAFVIESTSDGTGSPRPLVFRTGEPAAERGQWTPTGALQFTDGIGAAVSAAGTGAFRYNDTTKTVQVSLDAAVYVDVLTGTGTFFEQGGNAFGADAVLGTTDAFPLTFITNSAGAGGEVARFLPTGQFQVGTTVQLAGVSQILLVQNNANSATQGVVANLTSDTTASARWSARSASFRTMDMIQTSPGFTSISNGQEADSGHIVCGTGNALIFIHNASSAAQMKWKVRAVAVTVQTVDSDGNWVRTQQAATSGSPTFLTYTGAAHTGLANIEAISANFNFAQTVTFAGGGGAISTQRAVVFQAPTYDAAAAQTITDPATVAITGAPVDGGANMTFTNTPKALWVQGGLARFDGTVEIGTPPTYVRNATIVEDRTLLASASATATNNNNVLAALIADFTTMGLLS